MPITDRELSERGYRYSYGTRCLYCDTLVEIWESPNSIAKVYLTKAGDNPGVLEGHAKCFLGLNDEKIRGSQSATRRQI